MPQTFADLEGVHDLRVLADADVIHARMGEGGRDRRGSIPLIKAGSPGGPQRTRDEEVEIPRIPAGSG